MPDALSKTVPIWCAVMNRLLLEEDAPDPELFTPEASISRSEHSQIEARLDRFVKEARVCFQLLPPQEALSTDTDR